MARSVCDPQKCTSCGVCETVCPKKCIIRQQKEDSSWYMGIDEEACINCGLCQQICPSVTDPGLHTPQKAYAAWVLDSESHRLAASGGIATALYQEAVKHGFCIVGAGMQEDLTVRYSLSADSSAIAQYRNSKYTFSDLGDVPKQIVSCLKKGQSVLFIGLPCHVAAVKNYAAAAKCEENLYCVDLVCHGLPIPDFFRQHIRHLETVYGKSASEIFFRNPDVGTGNFVLSVAEGNGSKPFYQRYVGQDDVYQIGYHNALIYKDTCYRCAYAQKERPGDLTLADYPGLGQLSAYRHNRHKVSMVAVSTQKGEKLWDILVNAGIIESHERPVEEPLKYQKQMRRPSIAPKERVVFLKLYKETGDFEAAATEAFRPFVKRNAFRKAFPVVAYLQKIPRVAKRVLLRLLQK